MEFFILLVKNYQLVLNKICKVIVLIRLLQMDLYFKEKKSINIILKCL